ncbi:MAG: hypothetical protein R3D63_00825 [Paracoccaceae bacterium]
MGKFRLVPCQCRRYALAESDRADGESDAFRIRAAKPPAIIGEIVTSVMQWLQGRLAGGPLALHMQQDYLAVIAAQCRRFMQN